jgi:hypothetical protein
MTSPPGQPEGEAKLQPKPGFTFGVHCALEIASYSRAVLSVPAILASERLDEKELCAAVSAPRDGKRTLDGHLDFLRQQGAIREDVPLLVVGLRNNLVNLRAPVIVGGRFYGVEGETPAASRRPYYGIGSHNGKLVMGTALGTPSAWPEFFCAGIPVLWDGMAGDTLLDLMLIEAADHSHLFHLPRGNHPLADDNTRADWCRLHEAFGRCLYADASTAVSEMRAAAAAGRQLVRTGEYLHAVLGVRADGTLVCICAHGRLEDVGALAAQHGCHRAICVENSGSVMPTYLPAGIDGERIPLLRAPNFRPYGRALLAIELTASTFEGQSVIGRADCIPTKSRPGQ